MPLPSHFRCLSMLSCRQVDKPVLYDVVIPASAYARSYRPEVDLFPFPEICLRGIQYHLLVCDEFSTYVHSFSMKTKSNLDIIVALILLVSHFKQFGHNIKFILSDHETALISAISHLNLQGIQHNTISPQQYQHEQKFERYIQTINARFRSVQASLKFKLPTKLYGQLFTAIINYLNIYITKLRPSNSYSGHDLQGSPKGS